MTLTQGFLSEEYALCGDWNSGPWWKDCHPGWIANLMYYPLLGLAQLHEKGYVHNDVVPENLVIMSYEPLYSVLIDFGRASKLKDWSIHDNGTLAPKLLQGGDQ